MLFLPVPDAKVQEDPKISHCFAKKTTKFLIQVKSLRSSVMTQQSNRATEALLFDGVSSEVAISFLFKCTLFISNFG